MKKLNRKSRVLAAAALCVLVAGTAGAFARQQLAANRAAASGRPEIRVALAATVARADERIPVERAGVVRSGEVLDWTITSANEGDGPAREYRTVGQIPQGTSLVAGSVTAEYDAAVTYSIDGGKTYSAQPTIAERQPDGTFKQVPAPVALYTQVRYEWAEPLAAGQKLAASYKVRVK